MLTTLRVTRPPHPSHHPFQHRSYRTAPDRSQNHSTTIIKSADMDRGGLPVRLWCGLASLCAGSLLPRSSASHGAATASDGELLRLGVNRLARNVEVERLVAKYQLAALKDDQETSAMASVLRSLMAGVSSKMWWLNAPTLALADAGGAGNQAMETKIRTGEGSHTISVYVGGQLRELILDTGSGKTAFVCEGCSECGNKHTNKPFHMTNATKYSTCDPNNLGDEDMGGCMRCQDSKCRYGQRYVEGDYWEAYKVSDVLSFSPPGTPNPFQATIEFGCIYEQTGCFNEQSSDGIMGFSRHPDSIFEQFHRAKVTPSRIFAQCLADDGGALTLGGVDMHVNKEKVMYTPLRDTGYQYWTVHLESISIGKVPMSVDHAIYNHDRGCVFDSGTTFLYLPTRTKTAFVDAWRQATGGSEASMPISETYHHMTAAEVGMLPEICFHFANEATLCMAPDAYLFKLAENQYAGTVFFGDEMRSTIVGASALAHHNIIYDIDNYRIGIAKADCDAAAASAATTPLSALASEQMIALELHPGGDKFKAAIDHEFWTQVALASVACCAMAGLLVTVWEELRRPVAAKRQEGADEETVVADTTDEATDFAFVLMEGDA